jgi:hypothetical protein
MRPMQCCWIVETLHTQQLAQPSCRLHALAGYASMQPCPVVCCCHRCCAQEHSPVVLHHPLHAPLLICRHIEPARPRTSGALGTVQRYQHQQQRTSQVQFSGPGIGDMHQQQSGAPGKHVAPQPSACAAVVTQVTPGGSLMAVAAASVPPPPS